MLRAPVTSLSHPYLKMEAQEEVQQFVAFPVNFGQIKKVKIADPLLFNVIILLESASSLVCLVLNTIANNA